MRVSREEKAVTISENLEAMDDDGGSAAAASSAYNTHTFTFDHVYDQHSDQIKVYKTTAESVVNSSLMGYNATIFACKCLCMLPLTASS